LRIGITGHNGFIGYHLYQTLKYKFENYIVLPFQRSFFENPESLNSYVSSCDVIIHLAGVNRADSDNEVYDSNMQICTSLNNALLSSKFKGHLIFASSCQEDIKTPYGKAKKESRLILAQTIEELGGAFSGLVIPNVFGPFCKPNYNSFIATFCNKILNKEEPVIIKDEKLHLIYVGNLVNQIIKKINIESKIQKDYIIADIEIKVSKVLSLLYYFKDSYFDHNTIPRFNNSFEKHLFSTFKSYIDLEEVYPINLTKNLDERGFFSEIIKTEMGGQFSYSTTLPGVTRGNHFHTKKIERFIVIAGKAKISLRKIGSSKVHEFLLDDENPSFVDMPIWYTHNIKNIGTDDLITLFWINEPFDENKPDTYLEKV
tara:strand:- start:2877 stop:3992 length:1116 start_codon:yes stop_codon:yes gene_type:complete